jgi:carboxypeptidase Q
MNKNIFLTVLVLSITFFSQAFAQNNDSIIIQNIIKEATNNSQLKPLAHELLDDIGPRLVGTPQMQAASDWAIARYKSWGIDAKRENWGQWRGWERGISHIDMVYPRVKSLEGMQLAWSPSTKGKTITADVIILPDVKDSIAFQQWLPNAKGKFILVSVYQPTGRSDANWQEFSKPASFDRMKTDRQAQTDAWQDRVKRTGYTTRTLPRALDSVGAAGVVSCTWSKGFGVDKIFGAYTKRGPSVDVALEDYDLLYRMVEAGEKPRISVYTDSKDLGIVPTFNTIAEIKGAEKPDEYVVLSAHFDSWDGAAGATDNGTGTLTMMEAARILSKIYPHPKRTILIGHWGSEEQGLNGSRAFVVDHPEIVQKVQAVFNQDNGTGRITDISGQGFLNAYEYVSRWLTKVPDSIRSNINTSFPGMPGGGGSDFASFVAVGAPAFSLSSLSWDYGVYTWHTNRDTYDKIVWDDLQNNVILTAILAYMASEDPAATSRERSILPIDVKTGERSKWPEQKKANRRGGLD